MRKLRPIAAALIAAGGLTAAGQALAAGVVISQIYGSGGASGAPWSHDYVELFNAGNAAVDVSGWSVQYASATGTGNFGSNSIATVPAFVLQPGQYLLVRQNNGGGTVSGAALPTPDATGNQNMSGTGGKVALISSSAGLACNGSSTPCSSAQLAQIVDLVGYGGANYAEGSPAPSPSTTNAIFRAANGCTDSNNNSADFASGAASPRNSASPLAPCSTPVNAPIVPNCPASVSFDQGVGGTVQLSASDADSVVNAVAIESGAVAGLELSGFSPAAAEGAAASVSLVADAALAAGSYPLVLRFDNDEVQSATCSTTVTIAAPIAPTPIGTIQGSGDTSPLVGQTVTTEGVVSAVFPGLSGYYLQSIEADADPASSDGIFVYAPSGAGVAVGDYIRLSGTVNEFFGVTELVSPTDVSVLATGAAPAPIDVVLPEAVEGELERYEGMLVRLTGADGALTASQNFFQGRYGQVTLAAGGRLENPTNRYRANSAEALAAADENARRRIILDDGASSQNPNPIPYIGADNTLRAGDTTPEVVGVIDYGLATNDSNGPSDYRIHPVTTPSFTRVNARSSAPEAVGGNVRVASFNVLNYFTTIDQSGASCAPSGTRSDCRGADSSTEFERQRAKIIEAIAAIAPDVAGLMEMQNNGNTAVQNLVDGLNARLGAGTYAAVPLPPTPGTDAIRVAMIYRPGKLSLVGSPRSDADPVHNRPPFAHSFAAANGEKFSVIVNHFKSRGCDDAVGLDMDQGDGQGCYNLTRVQQAQALLSFIDTVKASAGDQDVLVIGDLNAYGAEDPIYTLTDAGLVNELAARVAQPYSFVFDGAAGYLDHALTTASLSAQVSGVTEWHINTDEPSVIDYNTEFKPQDLYSATPYRSSDHDPVIVGLKLTHPVNGGAARDTLVGTVGDDVIYGAEGADTLTGNGGADVFVYRATGDAADAVTDFVPGNDKLDLSALFAALGVPGDAFAGGWARFVAVTGGSALQIDADGPSGSRRFATLVTLRGVSPSQLDAQRDVQQ